jgi:hypothetical protein
MWIVLHPHHKLWYFKNIGWEDEWIEHAEDIVHTEFDESYGLLNISWTTTKGITGKSKVSVFK